MKGKWLLVALALHCCSGWAQLFIGNGGEGWLMADGRLTVRDLAENGIKRDVYFGSNVDPWIAERAGWLRIFDDSFAYDKQLLAQKLSDLNGLYPDLGEYVLLAMRSYSWSFTDEKLKTIPGDEPVIQIVERVQLANRLQNHIRIHRASWDRLNSANKIALLIHEGIFGLITPVCKPGGSSCVQPAYKAREVVAQAFLPPWLRARGVGEIVAQATGLPEHALSCQRVLPRASFQAGQFKFELRELYLHETLRAEPIAKFCAELGVAASVEVRLTRSPLWITREFYPVGHRASQLWIKASRLVGEGATHLHSLQGANCEQRVHSLIQKWFFSPVLPSAQSETACSIPRIFPEEEL